MCWCTDGHMRFPNDSWQEQMSKMTGASIFVALHLFTNNLPTIIIKLCNIHCIIMDYYIYIYEICTYCSICVKNAIFTIFYVFYNYTCPYKERHIILCPPNFLNSNFIDFVQQWRILIPVQSHGAKIPHSCWLNLRWMWDSKYQFGTLVNEDTTNLNRIQPIWVVFSIGWILILTLPCCVPWIGRPQDDVRAERV